MTYFPSVIMAGALAFSAPQPPEEMVRDGEYPVWALKAGAMVFVHYELAVDPEGKVMECKVLSSVGSKRLAEEVCKQRRRLKMTPAKDDSGNAVFGKYVSSVTLTLPGSEVAKELSRYRMAPDVEISVAALPDQEGGKKTIGVDVQVSGSGLVVGCRGSSEGNAAFNEIACDTISGQELGVMMNRKGEAVPYNRQLTVAFVAQG